MSTFISCIGRTPIRRFDETMRALDDIVRQGKARYIGVSNFRLAQIEECMRLRQVDVVQYGWNMFDRRMQAEIFPYCEAKQIGVMAYGSLAYGMLSGTFHAGMQFEESDWRSRGGMVGNLNLFRTLFGPEHFPRNLDAVEDLKRLAAKYDKTLPQFALRWTLSNPVVGTALVGFREPGRGDRKPRGPRLDHLRRRHGGDRRHSRPAWLRDRPAGLARRLACVSLRATKQSRAGDAREIASLRSQ